MDVQLWRLTLVVACALWTTVLLWIAAETEVEVPRLACGLRILACILLLPIAIALTPLAVIAGVAWLLGWAVEAVGKRARR